MSSKSDAKIAIIGGGIAGSSAALYFSEIGLNVTLFEKGASLVNGPPMCHLHAGGNLYREISDTQCITLLKESIELLRFYPHAIDYRPTVIAVPTTDSGKPQDLYRRLSLLQQEYQKLINHDKHNEVLGKSSHYFKIFEREEVEALQKEQTSKVPSTLDEWMIPVAKNIDLNKVKFPLIIVQEYGLNMFCIASTVTLALDKIENSEILLNTEVTHIEKNGHSWDIEYHHDNVQKQSNFDYLINAAGFRSGALDDMIGYSKERLVEFKAAYVTKWDSNNTIWPEVIFFGERGTPNGMAQFTPYPGGYFQLHGMTKDITLFNDGLVKNSTLSAQPQLHYRFIDKIDKNWNNKDAHKRTELAINHLSNFIPSFKNSDVASKPLYGAQQIPGNDSTLRATDVSFEKERYARCEIVKASSVLTMIDLITKEFVKLNFLNTTQYGKRDFYHIENILSNDITQYAEDLCQQREYPTSLANRNVPQNKS
jgi:glycine/D-amino acid oxidase-like deaminating enzyme